MTTDAQHPSEPADGRPLVGPEDLVIPDDVESTITAGSPADTLHETSGDGRDESPDETGDPQAG